MKTKPKIIRILTYLCLFGYICLTAFLIYQASLDGKTSSGVSGEVGENIAGVIDKGDNTKLVNPTKVFINNPINEAKIGEKHTLNSEIEPSNSSYKSLIYETSDKSIATVNSSGVISFLSAGTVTITVYVKDFSSVKDQITIAVKEIELIDFTYEVYKDDKLVTPKDDIYTFTQYQTYDLNFILNPVDTTNKNVTYNYDKTYVNISNGAITPIKDTKTPIEIEMIIGDYKNVMRVVIEKENLIINPESVTINNKIETAKVGTTHTLKTSVLPANTTYKSLSYKSSDTKVATVNSSGKISFVNEGTVTITVYNKQFTDILDTMTVKVEKIALEDFTYEIYEGDTLIEAVDGVYNLTQYKTYSIKTEFTPVNASLKTISYSFSTKNVITISNGVISAKLPTTNPITVTMKCDGITKTFKVSVEKVEVDEVKLESITTSKPEINMNVGSSLKLTNLGITLKPTNVTDKTLIYSSSNTKVVKVDSSNLKALTAGESTITVTHEDTGKKVEIKVKVNNVIKLDGEKPYVIVQNYLKEEKGKYIIRNGFSGNIYMNFDSTSTFTEVEYSSSNTNVLVIGNDGVLSPVSAGEAIVTLKIDDGFITPIVYTLNIVVENPPYTKLTSFEADNKEVIVNVGDRLKITENPFDITFIPEDASNKTLTYKSNDSKIVSIDSSIIKALKAGEAIITISSAESNTSIEVKIKVNNIISVNSDEPITIKQDHLSYDKDNNVYSIRNGFSGKINVNFNSNSTYKTVVYTSSNEKVLTVGNDGVITPIKVGEATITVTVDDGLGQVFTYDVKIKVERTPLIEDFSAFLYKVRKSIGHFGAFLVLGILGTLSFMIIFDKKKWIFSVPMNIALGFGVAGITELIQKYVPGRYGCWDDVWLDFSGFMTSTIILTITVWVVYLVIYLKKRKRV